MNRLILLLPAVLLLMPSKAVVTEAPPRGGTHAKESRCARIPNPFAFTKNLVQHDYNGTTETLFLDLTDILYKFCNDSIYHVRGSFRVDLVSTTSADLEPGSCQVGSDPDEARRRDSRRRSKLQSTVRLSPTNPVTIFRYVQGKYFLRFSDCLDNSSVCKVVSCSEVIELDPRLWRDDRTCESGPHNVSGVTVEDVTPVLEFDSCSVDVAALVPLCTTRQKYNQVRVFVVELPQTGQGECTLEEFFQGGSQAENTTIQVRKCDDDDGEELCNRTGGKNPLVHPGLIRHDMMGLSRNSTYCVFYQLENPLCKMHGPSSSNYDLSCFFYSGRVSCQEIQGRVSPLSLFTEPVFIGVVSLTLVLSLALLMWTLAQCSRRRPESPVQQPIKKPPRSLTEDDLEHISRLPSQEIVLVYFPDTKRFKELNRKFRDWLITLDVNDVKDIYDEKCSEEVLKDPEAWVRKTLGGPEKRIILVCSRLAYECLVTVKKGISSPKFVETDPHFGLLTRSIQYLDREMRGNYRNLICVRYEDLKICDRAYSSEAFNIVPGTEYVLPQHLEDVYRWIHPRDPKPECWSETRQEVRELLDSMRKYRHHDDNMFAVQFDSHNNAGAGAAAAGPSAGAAAAADEASDASAKLLVV